MNYRALLPYEQKAVDRLEEHGCKAQRTTETCLRSRCPAHNGENSSLAIYLNSDGIAFICNSERCTHEQVRDALELTQAEITPPKRTLTIKEYADAKKLSVPLLTSHCVRQETSPSGPRIEFDYLDFDGEKVCVRQRFSISEGPRHKKGGSQRLYGMWLYGTFSDYLVIVEGESDCHTLWAHRIAAVGVPGAGCVKQVLADVEKLVQLRPELKLYALQEPGVAGHGFIKAFENATFRNSLRVVRLDEQTQGKDPSALHCKNPDAFLDVWNEALENSIPWSVSISDLHGKKLSDLAPDVHTFLEKRLKRSEKEHIADLLANLLLQNERLLKDVSAESDPVPYMLTDDGAAVAVATGASKFRYALQDCGLHPSEELFTWVTDRLKHRAVREGKEVRLERFSVVRDGKLYVSSGSSQIVVGSYQNGEPVLALKPNGEDGVLFAADACLPTWSPTESVGIEHFAALNPCLETADDAPAYSPEHQQLFFVTWLMSRIAGTTAPILTCKGAMSNGKSVTLRAVVKLFSGEAEDIANPPTSQRSFDTAATNLPIYAIDNLDSDPQSWFADTIAYACTGGKVTERKLFKDSELSTRAVTALMAVTTRSAAFAARSDIQDRTLPLYFGKLPSSNRVDESRLFRQVTDGRDGLLSWLAERVVTALHEGDAPQGKQGRFQMFAVLAESMSDTADEALRQLDIARRLAVAQPDTLVLAIARYFTGNYEPPTGGRGKVLQGNAEELLRKLRESDASLAPRLPLNGQAFGYKFRESEQTLKAMGFRVDELKRNNSKYYTITMS